MLDLCYPKFKRIVCVFMYVIPNLRHNQIYYNYAKKKYPRIEFVQVPHYAELSCRKNGALGRQGNKKQPSYNLSKIAEIVKERFGIEWVALGFKQSDSLNRRLMLRSYKDGLEAINWKGKKFFPLSTYKNRDVLDYIIANKLKYPEIIWNAQTGGDEIFNPEYLRYLQCCFPDDLEKIKKVYPAVISLL